jgi:hypothetical protein
MPVVLFAVTLPAYRLLCCVGLSDLWALGNCIYQFLTGVVPFKAASAYLIFMRAKVRTQGF